MKKFSLYAALIAIVLVAAGGYVWWDGNRRIREVLTDEFSGRESIVEIQPADFDEDALSYQLVNGWNLVAFPVVSDALSTANELVKDIALQGGYVTTVAYWDKDQWKEVSWRGDQQYGHDFDIELDKAYFIRNHNRLTWRVSGEAVSSQDYALNLEEGWNGVGILGANSQTAESFLDAVNQGEERAHEINRWFFGNWDPYVKRTYDAGVEETYGESYGMDDQTGYFVYVVSPVEYQLAVTEE